MGMNIGSGADSGDVIADINTTPLIDVMLVLLIMLIITIPIQLHAVHLNLPSGNPPPPEKPPEVVRIDVDATNRVLWNGEAVPTEHALEGKLHDIATLPEQPEVHLRPDKDAAYDTVARVLAATQREGIIRLGVTGAEQFQ